MAGLWSVGPGIVGSEVPDVTLRIAARVGAPPVGLVLEGHHDLRAGRDRAGVVLVRVLDDDVGALRDEPALLARRLLSRSKSLSRGEPSMIIPFPNPSWAWVIVPPSPGTTRSFSKPKASQSHSMARGASRYRSVGMMLAVVFLALSAMIRTPVVCPKGTTETPDGGHRAPGPAPDATPLAPQRSSGSGIPSKASE